MPRSRLPIASILVLVVVIFSLVMMVLGGCKEATAPATSTPPETSAQLATPPQQSYNLKLWLPMTDAPGATDAKLIKQYIEEVSKQTNGKVTITPYWGMSLTPGNQLLDGLKSGLVDIAFFPSFFAPGAFPVSDITTLPWFIKSIPSSFKVMDALYDNGLLPELQTKEFRKLGWWSAGSSVLIFRDKKVTKLEDFKGMKMGISGTVPLMTTFQNFGTVPVSVTMADVHMSLDRGVIEGNIAGLTIILNSKRYEVVKYLLDNPLGYGLVAHLMNQKAYDSLPPEYQKAIDQVFKAVETQIVDAIQKDEDAARTALKQYIELYKLSDSELKRLQDVAAPVIDEWVKQINEKGLPGQKIMEVARTANQ